TRLKPMKASVEAVLFMPPLYTSGNAPACRAGAFSRAAGQTLPGRGGDGPVDDLGDLAAGGGGSGAERAVPVAADDAVRVGGLDGGVERLARRHIGEVRRGRRAERPAPRAD